MTLGPDSSTATAPSHQDAGFPPSDQKSKDEGRATLGTESKSLSDESPAEDSDAVQEVEFKEGGYGWLVSYKCPLPFFYTPYLLTLIAK